MNATENTFGRVGANRSYRDDRQPADSHFERLAWPVLKDHVGGGEIINTALLGSAGGFLDRQAGIDFIWTSGDGRPAVRHGYGALTTGGDVTPPTFVRGVAARFQYLDYKTFTIRALRYSGAKTELEKRLEQTLANHDHGEMVAGYTAHAYGCERTKTLLRVAMVKTRDLMMVYRYGVEGRDYYKQSTNNADFICFDWDILPEAYVRSVGCQLWIVRVESPSIEQKPIRTGFFGRHGEVSRGAKQ